MDDIQKKIIGTWKLVYSVEIDAQGNKFFPFGDDAIGYIMYDASGKMAVQICRRNRKKFSDKSFVNASEEELLNIPKDYLAYFGRYDIDLQNEVIQHLVEGSLFPNYIEQSLPRKYHFYEDKMSLKPWDGTNREILWQKI